MKKLILGSILALVVTVGASVATGSLASAATPPDSCFDFSAGAINDYYDNEGNNGANPACPRNVDIPSTIGGIAVTTIGNSAFDGKQLTAATIPTSVTTIGSSAFQGNLLGTVIIPNSVTSIGYQAFGNNQLTSVSISNSLTLIDWYVFNHNQLTSVVIPNSVTAINGSAFSNNQLTSVTLSNSLTSIGRQAFGSNRLTTVTIPNSVTSIHSEAFTYQNPLGSDLDLVADPTGYATIWYVRLYTANPSNPHNLQDGQALYDEQADIVDYNNDGDMNDILSVGGHLINPSSTTISYKNTKGDTLQSNQTITGLGLSTYLAGDNDTNDLARYYRMGATQPFAAPNITGYSVVTPSSPHTMLLASAENTLDFAYSNPALPNPSNNGADLADTGTNIWYVAVGSAVLIAGSLVVLAWRKYSRKSRI